MFDVRYADELSTPLPNSTYQHAATARRRAALEAAQDNRDVAVCAEGKPRYIICPDGSRKPPLDMRADPRETCIRSTGRPCFCTACRNERKASRC